MVPLILQLFTVFLPIYQQIRADYKASNGVEPTDADVIAKFESDIAKYLAEGADWKATHPK